jgi:hypothetical protein
MWKAFEDRLNPNLPLQALIANLLPPDQRYVKLLDGPVTIVGKKYLDYDIDLTAVDPLANEYDKLISKYRVNLPVKTRKADAEKLTEVFPEIKSRMDELAASAPGIPSRFKQRIDDKLRSAYDRIYQLEPNTVPL